MTLGQFTSCVRDNKRDELLIVDRIRHTCSTSVMANADLYAEYVVAGWVRLGDHDYLVVARPEIKTEDGLDEEDVY